MRLQLLLLTLLLSILGSVYSQEPIYKWGPPATNDYSERKLDKVLSLGDEGFVLLRKFTDKTFVNYYWIEQYDAQLRLVQTTAINFNLGVMGDSYFIEDIQAVNGQIYAFVSHWDKAAGSHSLILNSLSMDGELKMLAELEAVTAEKLMNKGTFKFSFSDDGSKLLVLSELPFEKKTNEKIRLTCYELNSLSRLWQHEQVLETEAAKAVNNQISLSNEGNAYIFKKYYNGGEWHYLFYECQGPGKWSTYTNDKLAGKVILDQEMLFNNKGEFIFYATYTERPSAFKTVVEGTCFFNFGSGLQVLNADVLAWNNEILSYFSGQNADGQARDIAISDLDIHQVIQREDGKLLVLFEQVKKDQKPIVGSSPMQFNYEWRYGNILVLCLEQSDGSLQWWQAINKHQETKNTDGQDDFGSFLPFLSSNRLFIFWNNTDLSIPSIPAANWTEPDGTKYVKHKVFDMKTMHASFMHVIEPDGLLAFENKTFGLPLFNLHKGAVFEMSLCPSFYFDLGGELVVMSMMHNGGKRYRFGFLGL